MKRNPLTIASIVMVITMSAATSPVAAQGKQSKTSPGEDQVSWFTRALEFRGIAVADDVWHIWGCSPIVGPEGKVHLFVARWPQETGHQGWYTHSQVVHYVSKKPEGPFVFSDVVLEGTGKKTWDKFSPHNPTIHKVNDRYALFYIANTGKSQRPRNQKIGLALSKSLYGPWKKVGTDGLVLSPPDDPNVWCHGTRCGVNNPAFLQHPDGRFFLYYKAASGRTKRMGVAIADKLEGHYIHHPEPLTKNEGVIEDGYAFRYGKDIYLVTTDNHGLIKGGGGLIWESEDGLDFSSPKMAFDRLAFYHEGGVLPDGFYRTKGAAGDKFERPQVLMIDGTPSYIYLPSGTNTSGGKGSAGYVLWINPSFLPENTQP